MVLTFIATFRFTVANSVTPFLIGEETEVQDEFMTLFV